MLFVEISPEIQIYGDAKRVKQILYNFFRNALEYASGSTVRIRAEELNPHNQVRIEISDNGPGIHKDLHEKLFKRFEQLSKVPGFGLGLFICRKMIEAHGGTLKLVSDQGKGTTFIFTLWNGAPNSKMKAVDGNGRLKLAL